MGNIKGRSSIYGQIEGKVVDQDDYTLHIELSKNPEKAVDGKKKGDYIEINKHAFSEDRSEEKAEPKKGKK